MKHEMKNSKNPGIIEFIPITLPEHKEGIRKGENGKLTIIGWRKTNVSSTITDFKLDS